MFNTIKKILWNWQNKHLAPRWISLNTGEVVSTLGRLLAGRYYGPTHHEQYVWVSLKKYRAGRYGALLAGEVESVTDWVW